MPTVEIPSKICKKCGSIRWRVHSVTGKSRCTDCANALNRKNYKPGSFKIKYDKNPAKYRALSRQRTQKYRLKNKEKCYKESKLYLDNQAINLGDLYIKHLLTKHSFDCFSNADIPQDLIDLKRKQLSLKRQLKLGEASDQASVGTLLPGPWYQDTDQP